MQLRCCQGHFHLVLYPTIQYRQLGEPNIILQRIRTMRSFLAFQVDQHHIHSPELESAFRDLRPEGVGMLRPQRNHPHNHYMDAREGVLEILPLMLAFRGSGPSIRFNQAAVWAIALTHFRHHLATCLR